MSGLGALERAVMECLWTSPTPLTVRQVHEILAQNRDLAYTTVMTVLQRLARKRLVIQSRDDRAHRYSPAQPREDLVATLLVDALGEAPDANVRAAALVRFIGQASPAEVRAMQEALQQLPHHQSSLPTGLKGH